MVLVPILGLLASVFGIIVLLEDDALEGPVIKCKANFQVILQNIEGNIPIHPSINLASISKPLLYHTAPNYQRYTSKLQGSFHQFITQTLSGLFPPPFHAIWTQVIDFGFIWPDNLLLLYIWFNIE